MPKSEDKPKVAVLMYHSISDHVGPTAIAPGLFAKQMTLLREAGYHVARLSEFAQWRRGATELPNKTVVLTFDDAFADFADNAAPEVLRHGWSATVFVPTSCVAQRVDWGGVGVSQSVLTWSDIRDLATGGFEFGSHAQTHADLTSLEPQSARAEIVGSKRRLEDELGTPVSNFAAPFGAINDRVRNEIAKHYELNAGVGLAQADRACDLFDVPRIEMHYFRDLRRWRDFLDGKVAYLSVRRALRAVRRSFLQ